MKDQRPEFTVAASKWSGYYSNRDKLIQIERKIFAAGPIKKNKFSVWHFLPSPVCTLKGWKKKKRRTCSGY